MKQFGAVCTHSATYQQVYSALTVATQVCCFLKPDDFIQKLRIQLIGRISDKLIAELGKMPGS